MARVIRPQGRRGEVIAEPRTNMREQFALSRIMSAVDPAGRRRELKVETHRFHQGRVVLKFLGVESISQAEELRDCELEVRRSELLALGPAATT